MALVRAVQERHIAATDHQLDQLGPTRLARLEFIGTRGIDVGHLGQHHLENMRGCQKWRITSGF